MARRSGPFLLLLLLALLAGLRACESARADRLLQGEAAARATLSALQAECARLLPDGRPLPDLPRRALAGRPGLRLLEEASREQVAYATDGAYVYGLAARTRREEPGGRLVQGWILRAWPWRFGVTGDREYHLAEDGNCWEGQNRLGRSGLDYGFPPEFPEPGLALPRAPWWRLELPPHR